MCGIMGFIGNSNNKSISYNLSTNIIRETEIRGRDATGFYCLTEKGKKFDFHKEPIPASSFVAKCKAWKKSAIGSNMLIGHTRLATHGTIYNNVNNHPHISHCERLAIVHNGVISGHKNIAFEHGFYLKSQCDSELILKFFEQDKEKNICIKELLKSTDNYYAGMACLAIDRSNTKPFFYAFRNSSYPLYFADLINELGQYFFFSSEEIWKKALLRSGLYERFKHIKVIPVPDYEIWKIDPDTLCIDKHKVENNKNQWSYFFDKLNDAPPANDEDYVNTSLSMNNLSDEILARIDLIKGELDQLADSISTCANSEQPVIPDYKLIDEELTTIEGVLQDLNEELPIETFDFDINDDTVPPLELPWKDFRSSGHGDEEFDY